MQARAPNNDTCLDLIAFLRTDSPNSVYTVGFWRAGGLWAGSALGCAVALSYCKLHTIVRVTFTTPTRNSSFFCIFDSNTQWFWCIFPPRRPWCPKRPREPIRAPQGAQESLQGAPQKAYQSPRERPREPIRAPGSLGEPLRQPIIDSSMIPPP